MRWLLGLLPFALAASCGGIISGAPDAGTGIPTTCSTDSDCLGGFQCAYPVADQCAAKKTCLSNPGAGACKAMPYCACDGKTTIDVCSAGASQPVAHTGPCTEPPPICGSLACEVCDVTGFSPSPQATAESATNACSSADISAFVTACVSSSATQATCTAWQKTADAGACAACILTQTTSASWGPIVCDSTQCILNDGGCVDIVTGQVALEQSSGGTGSCGDLVTARDQCDDYACGACTDSNDFTTCQSSAMSNECKSYADATDTSPLCASIDAGTSVCGPQGEADYAAFINVFCGSGN